LVENNKYLPNVIKFKYDKIPLSEIHKKTFSDYLVQNSSLNILFDPLSKILCTRIDIRLTGDYHGFKFRNNNYLSP